MQALIDTHCHINFKEFKDDAQEVIARSQAAGISLIAVGSQSSTSQRALDYAERFAGVWAAVGLHPIHLFSYKVETDRESFTSRAEEFDYEFYKKLASHQRVVAIGEMGLDYYRLSDIIRSQPLAKPVTENEIKSRQREVFLQGLQLAKEINKPLIIHTRQEDESQHVYVDVLELLKAADYYQCVLHCFSGSLEQAQQFAEKGCMFSFTGILTFKNARTMQAVAKALPLEQIMVETDAPYLAPEPHRGQRNEPSFVRYVAEKLAELRGLSLDETAEQTRQNAINFFKLPLN